MSRKHKGSEPPVSDEAVNSVAVAGDPGTVGTDDTREYQDEPREPVPPAESKADKFRRLANRRVNNALKTIRYVRNLGNRATYEYTEQQAQMILAVLTDEVRMVKEAFAGDERKDGFSL
jgi:hypothetical protein